MQNVLTLVRFLQCRRPILLEIATDICRYRSPWTRRDRPLSEWPTICPEVTPAARPATPLSPGEQSRETSVAARAAVVVGPRAHPRHFHPRANAAPVRGTPERRTAFGSSITPVLAPTRRRLNLRLAVVSDIAGNSRLHPADPSDLVGTGCSKE